MATNSSILAWRIPGMEEPGGLPSMGSHRVGHDWSDLATAAAAAAAAAKIKKYLKIFHVSVIISVILNDTHHILGKLNSSLFHLFVSFSVAPHSSTLARKIPWTEEPGRLQSMALLRVRHDWVTSLSLSTFMCWRRKWQPTPVFLPGESQGRGSLMGCHLWGHTELDTTEVT